VTGRWWLVAVVVAIGLSAAACQSSDGGETSTAGVADLPADAADSADTDSGSGTEGASSTDSSDGDGSSDGGSSDGDGGGAEPTEADFEEAQLAFESCMSDAGFEMDLGGGDGEVLSAEVGSSDGDQPIDGDGFQEAMEVCNEVFDGLGGSFDPSPEQEAEMRDAETAFANCMSDAGFEFETNGGVMAFESDDDDFEAMDAAMQKCSTEAFGEDGLIFEGSDE